MKFTSLASKFVRPAPKLSNHDWSYLHGTSMGVGPIYPLDVTEVNAGDSYYINPSVEIQTQPLVRPVLNDFNFDLYLFYSPQSLYCRALHSNVGLTTGFNNPLNYPFPYFNLESQRGLTYKVADSGDASSVYSAVTYVDNHAPQYYHPSAILGRLMLPPNYCDPTAATAIHGFIPTATKYNAMPLLLYMDICRSWFGNRQYSSMPFLAGQSTYDAAKNSPINSVSFSSFDSLFTSLTDGQNIIDWNLSSGTISNYFACLTASKQAQPATGLFLASQFPDINNTLLSLVNSSNYRDYSFVQVPSGDEGFAMDTFVQATRFWNFFNILSLVGDQYDEFSRGVYNVKPDVHLNKPVFLGKRSVPIRFTQIRSTVETDSSPLGSLGGNGYSSFIPSRRDGFRVSFSERGYLMVIAVIRPENMYSQSLPRFATKTTLADAFYPQFNDLGYEDQLYSDLRGSVNPSQINVSGLVLNTNNIGKVAIAKRPAWTEFRGKANRLSGLAADPTGIKPWFVSYEYNYPEWADISRAQLGDNVLWHYVDPAEYSDIFANSNRQSENFIVKIKMNWIARSEVSKRVLPRLTI